MLQSARLIILALMAVLTTTPAIAKHHKDEPVAEVQKGDRQLSCANIRTQLDQMKAAEKSGKLENPEKPKSHSFFAKVGRFGGRVINVGLIKTAV